MSVSNAIVNTSACLADGVCQSGTVLEYSCTRDYTITTPVTVCLANTSWSHRPTCLKQEGGRLKSSICSRYMLFCLITESTSLSAKCVQISLHRNVILKTKSSINNNNTLLRHFRSVYMW